MKKNIFVLLTVVSLFLLVACGNVTITADYGDAKSFETALNEGENLEGKIVNVVVDNLETQSVYGYNIWAGEHLNFVSEKNPNVTIGETISVKIIETKSTLGSWIITYEKINNAIVDDSTIISISENIQETVTQKVEETPKIKENKIVTLNGNIFYSVTDFEKYASDNNLISAQKNEDGTVSLTMTETRYEKLLNDTIETVEKSFSNSVQNNKAIKKIEHNKDLTELTILVDATNYNYKDDTTYYNAYMNTNFYRMLDKPDAKCKITIKDEITNELIYEITYPLDK